MKRADRLRDAAPPIYRKGAAVHILDQRLLPRRVVYRRYTTAAQIAGATRRMVLRGAPLIGCAAAYGFALASKGSRRAHPAVLSRLDAAARRLLAARPTAVNLAHAVSRMRSKAAALAETGSSRFGPELIAEADAILDEDLASNRAMALIGSRLISSGSLVMTHCNTGGIATAGIGTALGIIRAAHAQGRVRHVYACETRPYLQGARLTLWELMRAKVPCSLITDGMAGHILKTERVGAVIVGADRIAANGDAANKIGTYGLAVLARHHRVPFYVAAPLTTVDPSVPDGGRIPIEERPPREVLKIFGRSIAPQGARARHPAFDVTPARLVTAIVTDKGIARRPYGRSLKRLAA